MLNKVKIIKGSKKALFFLAVAFLVSCEKENIEDSPSEEVKNSQLEQVNISDNSWHLVSIVENGKDYTTECDKQNTLNLGEESQVTQIFFDSNEGECSQLLSVAATYDQTNNKFESEEKAISGTIEINDDILQVKYTGNLSGTVITYSK